MLSVSLAGASRGRLCLLGLSHVPGDPADVRELHLHRADGSLLASHGSAVGLRAQKGDTLFYLVVKIMLWL